MAICFWPTIQYITTASSSPTPITRDSQWTIAVVEATNAVVLLTGEIGDVMEVHAGHSVSNGSVTVASSAGTDLGDAPGFWRSISVPPYWSKV